MRNTDEIIRIFSEIRNPREMKQLLSELLTPAEIEDVALRWRLMRMLFQGVPQREIASQLGISLCKITRGSRVLKSKRSLSKRILNQSAGVNNESPKKCRKPA